MAQSYYIYVPTLATGGGRRGAAARPSSGRGWRRTDCTPSPPRRAYSTSSPDRFELLLGLPDIIYISMIINYNLAYKYHIFSYTTHTKRF